MSIIFENDCGYYISHKKYIDTLYEQVGEDQYYLNAKFFQTFYPYKNHKLVNSSKTKKVELSEFDQLVKQKFLEFIKTLKINLLFTIQPPTEKNKDALEAAETAYYESGKASIHNSFGFNKGPAKLQQINSLQFLFPANCEFFCKDISEISTCLENRQFDIILLDPPWWNKYIRRKRKKSNDGYKMMFNNELKNIPLEHLLRKDGLVVVWCTNSAQNLEELLNQIFPKWGIQLLAKWYWVKITQTGEPICDFSAPPGKQPYEKIIFGGRSGLLSVPQDGKLVVSVPSAIHSHKPPLIELLKQFLPENPMCLEVFARYLLPNVTSYGNEVLRLQHESLFIKTGHETNTAIG